MAGRKRIELAPALEAEIRARFERGESAATVKAAVPGAPSLQTLGRRQAEILGRDRAPVHKPPSARAMVAAAPILAPEIGEDAEDVPDAVPEGTPLEQIDRWIARLETAAAKAEANGNLAGLASLAAKSQLFLALRRKSEPLPKADPNEDPDLKALAVEGRATLEKLLNELFAPV